MECEKCGTANDSSNKFCSNCGNNLFEERCRNCGVSIAHNAVFCSNCGTKKEDLNNTQSESPVSEKEEVNIVNTNDETSNIQQPQELPEEVGNFLQSDSSSEILQESLNIEPIKTNKNMKWIIAGIASLLAVVGIGLFFLFPKSETVSTNNQTASKQTPVMDEAKMSIESVSVAQYPLVKMTVAIEGAPKDIQLSKDKLIISENKIPHEVKEVKKLIDNNNEDKTSTEKKPPNKMMVEVSYETTISNSNPPKGEKRNIELTYNNKKATIAYISPKQSKLRVDSFSCNTDDYPSISCFFSLFNQNNNVVDNIKFDPKYIKGVEDKSPLENISISKLSDATQYTSTNLVIDISTSMDDFNRIGQVKEAVDSFLNSVTISNKNVVGVLSFADSEYISQIPFTSDKNIISDEVNSFSTVGSCTALYESINEAVFNTSYNGKNGSKYVIAFTDGKDNCSDYVSSQTLINNALQLGVPIYAVSVEEDPELQRIAEETQGKYRFLGNDINPLYDFYREIFEDKKNQYVLTYKSSIPKKSPRNLQVSFNSPTLYTDTTTENVTPKLLNDYAVADVMQKYQIAWSQAMNDHDVSPIVPYVTQNRPATDKQSVYNIVYDQIYGDLTSSGARSGGLVNVNTMYGEELFYHIPDYRLVDAEKVSDDHYRLRIQKRVQRDANALINRNDPSLGFHPPLTTYKETAYMYNVIKVNNNWVIDTVDDEAVPICYTDATYTEIYKRKDGKSSQKNGNCPGAAVGER